MIQLSLVGRYEERWESDTSAPLTNVHGLTSSNFAYRGDGLRDSRAVSGGATTTFTWDVAGGLPVVLDDGNQYLCGAGLTAQKQSGSWYYYLADGLGSTMAVVNASGTVQNSYTYDVSGKPAKTGSLANEFDFAGQQTDGTGLRYLRARYYDPTTGMFLSRDPLSAAPRWLGQPFGYGNANPIAAGDPAGLKPTDSDGCGFQETSCQRSNEPYRGQVYSCSPAGCGMEFVWSFSGNLQGSGDTWWYDAVAYDSAGNKVQGRCTVSSVYGVQCSPTSHPLTWNDVGDLAATVYYGTVLVLARPLVWGVSR